MSVKISSLSAVVAALLLASTVDAQLGKIDQKCRDVIAKGFAKAIAAADKVSTACHVGRDASGGSTDCNDLSPAQADANLAFQFAQAKLGLVMQKKCIDAGASDTVLDSFRSCSEPCATETAVGNPLASYDEVADCLACLAREIVETRNVEVMGDPPAVPLNAQDATCHHAIGKSFGKRLKIALMERTKCQKRQDATSLDLQPCDTQSSSKLMSATAKASLLLASRCGAATLSNVDPCDGAANLMDLESCLIGEDDDAAARAFASAYELAATICPARVDATMLPGEGVAGTTRTFLDVGWTGLAHRMDLPDGVTLSLDVTCPASAPCGSCTVEGVSSAGPQAGFYTRCLEDVAVPCDEPFAPDVDDCGGDECVNLLGPPFPVSAGNSPVCVLNFLSQDVTGTLNPDDGSSELQVDLISEVHFGASLPEPCPVCEGDPLARDGVRGGTCIGGTRDGEFCDTQAFDAALARKSFDRGLSLDCPPVGGMNILPPLLIVPLDLTTGSASLGFGDACDPPLGFLDCACGICSLDPTLSCTNDAECSTVGAGACTYGGGAAATRRPNDCSDIVNGCEAIADAPSGSNRGRCNDPMNDTDTYCDGMLAQGAAGRPFVTCFDDSACTGSDCDPTTPGSGGCGLCTLTQRRECFRDPITATGDPDPQQPLIVTTFCVPPTNAFSINGSSGLPGPARTGIEMAIDLSY